MISSSLQKLVTAGFFAIALLRAQDPVSFALSVSANGAGSSTLYRGEPLIVQTVLLLETGEQATVAVQDAQKWDSVLTLTLSDSKGAGVPVPWIKLGATLDPLAFTAEATEASALFGLSAETIDSLEPGEYLLGATFRNDTSAAAGSWRGTLTAKSALSVSSSPRPDSPQSQGTTSRLRARWLQLNSQNDAALAELDTALERDPDDIQTLIDKADILAELGRTSEAVTVLTRAIEIFKIRNPTANHPPREILRRLRDLDSY